MTENTTDSGAIESQDSVQSDVASGAEEQKHEDKVAYDTYKRTLSEAKKYKSETSELQAKLEQYEKQKLEEQGKWKDLADQATQKAADYESKYKTLEARIAEERVRSQVELAAKDLGCVDTDLLIKAMDVDSLDLVDGYKVSNQSLEMVLNKAKQEKPYLFSKPAPRVQDGTPTSGGAEKTSLTDMSVKDRARMLFSNKN